MLQLNITINTVNAAFDESPEIECARILRELAASLEAGETPRAPRDLNGNKCGSFEIISE